MPEQRDQLDSDLTFEELTTAVSQLSLGRYAGIDGLPSNQKQNFLAGIGS